MLELALTGNRLRGLRVGAFAGLAQLRVLYLAGNQLVQLLDFTFLHLQVRWEEWDPKTVTQDSHWEVKTVKK